jgi:hypothetical protein
VPGVQNAARQPTLCSWACMEEEQRAFDSRTPVRATSASKWCDKKLGWKGNEGNEGNAIGWVR